MQKTSQFDRIQCIRNALPQAFKDQTRIFNSEKKFWKEINLIHVRMECVIDWIIIMGKWSAWVVAAQDILRIYVDRKIKTNLTRRKVVLDVEEADTLLLDGMPHAIKTARS